MGKRIIATNADGVQIAITQGSRIVVDLDQLTVIDVPEEMAAEKWEDLKGKVGTHTISLDKDNKALKLKLKKDK